MEFNAKFVKMNTQVSIENAFCSIANTNTFGTIKEAILRASNEGLYQIEHKYTFENSQEVNIEKMKSYLESLGFCVYIVKDIAVTRRIDENLHVFILDIRWY